MNLKEPIADLKPSEMRMNQISKKSKSANKKTSKSAKRGVRMKLN